MYVHVEESQAQQHSVPGAFARCFSAATHIPDCTTAVRVVPALLRKSRTQVHIHTYGTSIRIY